MVMIRLAQLFLSLPRHLCRPRFVSAKMLYLDYAKPLYLAQKCFLKNFVCRHRLVLCVHRGYSEQDRTF